MERFVMSKMKSYLDRLSALSPDQTMLDSDRLVLFLSGSSDITCAGLTAGQLDLLHAICPSGYSVVASNFPFNQRFDYMKSSSCTTFIGFFIKHCLLLTYSFKPSLSKTFTSTHVFLVRNSGSNCCL